DHCIADALRPGARWRLDQRRRAARPDQPAGAHRYLIASITGRFSITTQRPRIPGALFMYWDGLRDVLGQGTWRRTSRVAGASGSFAGTPVSIGKPASAHSTTPPPNNRVWS